MDAYLDRESMAMQYGFDIVGLMEEIRAHTAWMESLPPEEAEKEKLRNMMEAGIWDENGELTEPYRRTEL